MRELYDSRKHDSTRQTLITFVSGVDAAKPGNFLVENFRAVELEEVQGVNEQKKSYDLEAIAVTVSKYGRIFIRMRAREDVEASVSQDEEAIHLDR